MRIVYLALIVLFTAAVLVFKFQNLDSVTLTFLTLRATLPLSMLVVIAYVLGMITGGTLMTLLKGWIRGARVKRGAGRSGPEPE